MQMIGRQCRPQRAAGIAGRGLNPNLVEIALAQQLSIGHAVERHAACKTEVAHARLSCQMAGHAGHDDFRDILDRSRQIHVALGQKLVRLACRAAEERIELRIGHAQSGTVVEIAHVQTERPVFLDINQVFEDQLAELGLAVGRKAHDLVLAGIDLEPGVVREGRIEQTQGVGKTDLAFDADPASVSDAGRGGGPLPNAVHRQDDRLVEGRWIKGTGGMAEMMLGEQKLRSPVGIRVDLAQVLEKQPLQEQLFLQPQRHGLEEGAEATRREHQIGLDQPLELDERLFVEHDMIDVGWPNTCLIEAVPEGLCRKGVIMLLAREALFLGGRDNAAVFDQRGRAVVIEAGHANDTHAA